MKINIQDFIDELQDVVDKADDARYYSDVIDSQNKSIEKLEIKAERVERLEVNRKVLEDELHEARETGARIYEQNKRYREALENIKSVKLYDDFNPYAYMMLEIIEWAEKALEESK